MRRATPRSAILAVMPVESSTFRADRSRCIMGGDRGVRLWRKANPWPTSHRIEHLMAIVGCKVCLLSHRAPLGPPFRGPALRGDWYTSFP